MEDKDILQEEITLMKKLFDTKKGFVISEQAAASANDAVSDAGAIVRQLDAFNTKEQEIVNILKKYKTKQEFQNFLDTFKKIRGTDFGESMYASLNQNVDRKEWDDLSQHLASIGITLGYENYNKGNNTRATFKGVVQAPPNETRQGNINNIFCSVKGGKIDNAGSKFNGVTWEQWNQTYKITPQEIAAAKASCPNSELAKINKNTSNNGQVNVTQRFSKAASSLGIQNAKMDAQSLQAILNQLSGEQGGTPSVNPQTSADALKNTLNQLNTKP